MSTVLQERPLAPSDARRWLPWAALLAGLAALYVPTYVALANGLWRDEEYAHGPIIVAVFAWLVWRARAALLDEAASPPAPLAGFALLAAGLALYLLGRTQSLALFEVASHIPVIAGGVLAVRGWRALRALAFPLFFLVFLIPLPGFVLDFVMVPLKELVSGAVEWLLLALGYPVAREGVVLRVGEAEMLVADACSGLNSLYSLFALGLLYSQLVGRRGVARTVLLLVGIVPIAVAANVVRVLVLVLATYHLGEQATQGIVHDLAGLLVFVVAFALLLGYDSILRRFLGTGGDEKPRHEVEFGSATNPRFATPRASLRAASRLAVIAALAMGGTALAAPALKPVADPRPAPDLERVIPMAFGDWKLDPAMLPVTPAPDVQAKLDRLYRQVVSRTYVNSAGERMMLTVAYGGDQSDALKAHRQEVCYAAQGFEIPALAHERLAAGGRDIPVTRFLAVRGERMEPVTYWFTMGDRVVLGRAERLKVQLQHGLAGRIPDGMLVRVSSLSSEPRAAFNAQQAFMSAVVAALPASARSRFVGAGA